MFVKIARDIAKPQIFAILDLLKRSTGLSVSELAKALEMSYMGVKQHCIDLERKGLVDTRRRPGMAGRPEKAYRLTSKAAAFYPEAGNEFTLEILQTIKQIYGSPDTDKLLQAHFLKKTDSYLKKVKGAIPSERAASFARIRNSEGYCAELNGDGAETCQIVEFHHPMKELIAAFPSIISMELEMVGKILRAGVQRQEERAGGLIRVCWTVAAAADAPRVMIF
jgi:predicted ArsR family transcriptional regulator